MNFQIKDYQSVPEEDDEIVALLTDVFVKEGYTVKSRAEKMFTPSELQKRGQILLARSNSGNLLGMIILVLPTSPARQISRPDEVEIHLLAVYPKARGQGVGKHLIKTCEQRAIQSGFTKMVLSTQQTMKQAHSVYEKSGYRRNPTRDWSPDTNKTYLVYEKLLDQI